MQIYWGLAKEVWSAHNGANRQQQKKRRRDIEMKQTLNTDLMKVGIDLRRFIFVREKHAWDYTATTQVQQDSSKYTDRAQPERKVSREDRSWCNVRKLRDFMSIHR